MEDSAALVLEFSAADAIDVDEVERLACSMPTFHVVAVAQALTNEERTALGKRFSKLPNLEVCLLGAPIGRGAAIRAGLSRVEVDVVAIVSLDEIVDPAVIAALVRRLAAQPDVDGILAARSHLSAQRGVLRAGLSRGYNMVSNALFGLAIRDVQAPLKVFKYRSLVRILDNLQLRSHAFDVDLLYNARRFGLRIAEVTIGRQPRPRRWPVIETALSAISSLVVLRLVYSRAGAHPLIMRLGRPYIIMNKRSFSVLIFCWRDPHSPSAGGGEVYLHEQARHWVAQGHAVTWVAQGFRGGAREEQLDGIRIVRVGSGLTVFPTAILWYIFRSGWRFDFVLDVMNGFPFFTPIVSGKPKACLVYHVHATHFRDELPGPLADIAIAIETKLVPWIYRRTRFLTISASSARELVEYRITDLPIEIIHSGVDDTLLPGTRHAQPTVLYLGRLRRYKGIRKLIDAFVIVKRVIPDARLVIAGSGDDEPSLRAYTTSIDGIEFTGRVDNDRRRELYQEAWVLGMPSKIEGWGIVVIEAASCGTPTVAYNVNGLRDCIVDDETGFLVQSDAEFVERLRMMLSVNPDGSQMMYSCMKWSRNFSWDRTAERTLEQVRRSQLWSVAIEPQNALASASNVGRDAPRYVEGGRAQ